MAGLGVVHTIGGVAALKGGGGKGKRTKGVITIGTMLPLDNL